MNKITSQLNMNIIFFILGFEGIHNMYFGYTSWTAAMNSEDGGNGLIHMGLS